MDSMHNQEKKKCSLSRSPGQLREEFATHGFLSLRSPNALNGEAKQSAHRLNYQTHDQANVFPISFCMISLILQTEKLTV
jgi:hypothetical protein